MENDQLASFCHQGSKMGFVSWILRIGARDMREKVGNSLGAEAMATMSWAYFVSNFKVKCAPAIEVQQL